MEIDAQELISVLTEEFAKDVAELKRDKAIQKAQISAMRRQLAESESELEKLMQYLEPNKTDAVEGEVIG